VIHVTDDPHHCDPEHDDLAAMAGTRVGHEVLGEDVLEVRVQHARQSFRSARRELSWITFLRGLEPEPGDDAWELASDHAARTAGRRPLVSP
jgi:hypothetical protein